MVRSSRSTRAAKKPPATMPSAPASMKPVTTIAVSASGSPYSCCSAGLAKL